MNYIQPYENQDLKKTKKELADFQDRVESNARTYSRVFNTVFVRGLDSILEDNSGKQYIDFLAGAGTLVTGHNHPAIVSKIREFLDSQHILHGLDMMTPVRETFMNELINCLPLAMRDRVKIQFCGGAGADATEAALKLFKTATGRRTIVAFHGAYHGMTSGALSITGNLQAKNEVASLLPDVHFLPFPYQYRCPYGAGGQQTIDISLRHIRQVLSDPESGICKPAAVILEVVQGEGGCIPAPPEWIQGVRRITTDLDIPLIVDEIQTGFGRTGHMFAFEESGIIPDAVLISKGAGGGLPLSLVVYQKKYDKWQPGAHAGTFRGNQMAMLAGLETMDIIHRDRLISKTAEKGEFLKQHLEKLKKSYPCIGDVRGKGLMAGMEIIDPNGPKDNLGAKPADGDRAFQIKKECFERGLILETGGRYGAVLRFLPALTVGEDLIRQAIMILSQAIQTIESRLEN